ncbi:hypothetical protein Acr_16g0005460 [Actinidia rufa]|uniref:Uncharacterized protein n=1 Tax=Actinidia rufa TaxID=165716 RepID=A0A7J0FYZ0_9ERIC|nr:hypothetical protein Acr_16g0005460 [Actinidia rufa]
MWEEAVSEEATLKESLRVRRIIRDHFEFYGAPRVRELPPEQFCRQGFVLGKASEAGFGNEMYKILTAAGLSVMLNRGKFPFESYLSYTKRAFTLKEVKHLWRLNDCMGKYGRRLIVRTDDFEKPTETNVLPNIFGELMRVIISPSRNVKEAVDWVLNGGPDPHLVLHMRMRTGLLRRNVLISNHFQSLFSALIFFPTTTTFFVLGCPDPLTTRLSQQGVIDWSKNPRKPSLAINAVYVPSPREVMAATNCVKNALLRNCPQLAKPRVVLVSDTPSVINDITPKLQEFAEVLRFDYNLFEGNISTKRTTRMQQLGFRVKDWGPAPRWVAFVDFLLRMLNTLLFPGPIDALEPSMHISLLLWQQLTNSMKVMLQISRSSAAFRVICRQ